MTAPDSVSRDQRFPPSRRLLHQKEFNAVFREGRKFVRPSLIVYVRPRPEGEMESRLGLAVGRKVGKAVVRNRARRRIREIFRRHHGLILNPQDIVVVGRPRIAESEFPHIRKDLLTALERLGVLVQSEADG